MKMSLISTTINTRRAKFLLFKRRLSFNALDKDFPLRTRKCIDYCENLLMQVGLRVGAKPQLQFPSRCISQDQLSEKKIDIQNTINVLDIVSNNLCSIIDYAEAAQRLSPGRMNKGIEESCILGIEYMNSLNSDKRLYDQLCECLMMNNEAIEKGKEGFLDDEAIRVGESLKRHFEVSGINLSTFNRGLFQKLQSRIVEFGKVLDDSSPNLQTLYRLVRDRHKLSKLLGHSSYLSLVQKDMVIDNEVKLHKFLQKTKQVRSREGEGDFSFVKKRENLDFKGKRSLNNVISRINEFCVSCFDVNLGQMQSSVTFGCDSLTFECTRYGQDHGQIIVVPIIPFQSPLGPCHLNIRTWRGRPSFNSIYNSSQSQTPICIITCPILNQTCLKDEEIKSLYHEFGHAIHTILGKTEYHHLSGTRCQLDYAEVPSSLFEIIAGFHTNTAVPQQDDALIAELDLLVHGSEAEDWSSFEAFNQSLQTWLVKNSKCIDVSVCKSYKSSTFNMPELPFRHLYHYGGGCFSYVFGQRIAKLVHSKYFTHHQSFPFNPKRFANLGLAVGGTRTTKEIIESLDLLDQI